MLLLAYEFVKHPVILRDPKVQSWENHCVLHVHLVWGTTGPRAGRPLGEMYVAVHSGAELSLSPAPLSLRVADVNFQGLVYSENVPELISVREAGSPSSYIR